jgi:uncharacterized repeat protein (TIGR01451 family)
MNRLTVQIRLWYALLAIGLGVMITAVLIHPLLAQFTSPVQTQHIPTDTITINEIRIDQPGTDFDEYFELAGTPGMTLTGLTYLVIGDGATEDGSGVIEAVVPLIGVMPMRGYFLAVEATFTLTDTADLTTSLNFENSDNVTHLLVRDFTGANGDDLDPNDDGVLEITPWSEIVDLIAVIMEENPPDSTEYHYGPPTVGPDGSVAPWQVFRCLLGWEIGERVLGITDTPGAANVCPQADVAVDKSGPTLVQPGSIINYTISYENEGTAEADAVLLSDRLPDFATYFSDNSGLPCSACLPGASGVLTWTVGTMLPAASDSFVLTVLISEDVSFGETLTNTAVITTTSLESDTSNNLAQWLTQISPLDLVVQQSGMPLTFAGETVVYTLTLQNNGVATASGTLLTNTLPLSTTYLADSAPWPVTVSGNSVTWTAGDVPASSSTTFHLTATVGSNVPSNTILTNTLTATTDTPGDNPGNNTAVWETLVYQIVPIATARAGNVGELFGVEGQVIYTPGTYHPNGWGLQDSSGGIAVFYDPPPAVNLGDTIRLVATRGAYQNEEQLGVPVYYFENRASGPEVPPTPFNTSDVPSGLSEGWLAIITGTVSNLNCPTEFYLDDGSGAALVYVDETTGIDVCGEGLENGVEAAVIGFSSQYQTDYEVKPRRPADIIFTPTAPQIRKQAPLQVEPNSLFTYTISVANQLGYTLTNVVITDEVPALADFAYALDGGVFADGVVTWMLPTLADGSSIEVRFVVTAAGQTAVIANQHYAISAANFITPTFGLTVETLVVSGTLSIHHIQGARHFSLLDGAMVRGVQGVVTAVGDDGFYLQDPNPDDNEATSEGIFVYVGDVPDVAVGDLVSVTGRVHEYYQGGVSSGNLSTTEIEDVTVAVLSSGNPLPPPVVLGVGGRVPPNQIIDNDSPGDVNLTPTFDPDEDGIDFYESLEGMRVQVNQAIVVGSTSFGDIVVVGDAGSQGGIFSPRGALVVRPNDFNPERIIIADDLVPGAPDVVVGDAFSAPIVGVMDYSFGNFKLLNTAALPAVTSGSLPPESTPLTGNDDQLTVATFNLQNLDPEDDPEKVIGLATQIVENLQAPDIIAVEEIQDNNGTVNDGTVDASETYNTLIETIIDEGGPLYEYREIVPQNNQDGGEAGGNIRVGFLFRPDRVTFVDRAGGTAVLSTTVSLGSNGVELSYSPGRIAPLHNAFANSRKPLAGEFIFNGYKLIVIANHFASKLGDDSLFGRIQPPILHTEAQRLQQAQVVHQFVQAILDLDPAAKVIVLGDLNDFPFSPPIQALEAGLLTNLVSLLPEDQRYSYLFEGNAQVLDQILVSGNLAAHTAVATDIVHVNAEFERESRPSDHDPVLAQFTMPQLVAGFSSNSPVLLGGASIFDNHSVGALSYEWDFGDGVGSSTAVNPTYVYATEGTYTVVLTATNALGQDVFTQTHTIVEQFNIYLPVIRK